jgi:hypothetical protein
MGVRGIVLLELGLGYTLVRSLVWIGKIKYI